MSQTSPISGFTIARNVVKFKYPFEQWCQSMANLNLAEVVIGYDPTTDDGTHELMLQAQDKYGFRLFESVWDMDNFQGGTELGIQTDKVMSQLKYGWHLYVQLDEAFHEEDAEQFQHLVQTAPPHVIGFDFLRVYFYGNLHTIRKDWSVVITRLTRKGTHTYSKFDGMNCEIIGGTPGDHGASGLWMYHYSRIGEPEVISQRVRNMDSFYHPEQNLLPTEEVPEYDFVCREFDNYAREGSPQKVNAHLLTYQGTHPKSFSELYQEFA